VKQHDNSEAMRLADYARGDEYQRAADDAVDLLRKQSARIAELEAERDNLHTTMLAAAVEIQAHWDAHCDAEGYGPANLMHRLERGIASLYGYDAKTLQRVETERDQLRAEVERTSNNRDMWKGQCERQAEQLAQLRAEVERLRPNAERYEWLRDNHESDWAICEWQDDPDGLGYYRDARASHIVDAAIDAARTTHKETE